MDTVPFIETEKARFKFHQGDQQMKNVFLKMFIAAALLSSANLTSLGQTAKFDNPGPFPCPPGVVCDLQR